QLMLKGAYAYHGLIRVPFIWAEPAVGSIVGAQPANAGKRSDALFGTLDIAATFLDRARLAPYNGLQGGSLLPALSGSAGHDGVLIEYSNQRRVAGLPYQMSMRTL